MLTTKLGQIIERAVPDGRKIFAKRAQGKVFAEWTPLARLVLDGPEKFTIEWNLKLIDELRIQKVASKTELNPLATTRRMCCGVSENKSS